MDPKRRLILNDNHTDQHQFAIQPLDTKISVTTTEAMIQTQTQTRSWKDQTSHDLEHIVKKNASANMHNINTTKFSAQKVYPSTESNNSNESPL